MIHPDLSKPWWIDLKVPMGAEKAPLSDGGVRLQIPGCLFNKIFQNREKIFFFENWIQLVKTSKMIYKSPGPYVFKNIVSAPTHVEMEVMAFLHSRWSNANWKGQLITTNIIGFSMFVVLCRFFLCSESISRWAGGFVTNVILVTPWPIFGHRVTNLEKNIEKFLS